MHRSAPESLRQRHRISRHRDYPPAEHLHGVRNGGSQVWKTAWRGDTLPTNVAEVEVLIKYLYLDMVTAYGSAFPRPSSIHASGRSSGST